MNVGVGRLPDNVQLVNVGRQKAIKLVISNNDKDFTNLNNFRDFKKRR